LAEADELAGAIPFVEFMLQALRDASGEAVAADQVKRFVEAIGNKELNIGKKSIFRLTITAENP
jgi:hypothetical protein